MSARLAGPTSVMEARVICSPSLDWVGSLEALSTGGLQAAASVTSGGRFSANTQMVSVTTARAANIRIPGMKLRLRNGRPCLSKAVPSVICVTTRAL